MVRQQVESRGIVDRRVMEAMRQVPRHLFAPGAPVEACYRDRPVPIGHGQTMSQPYMVALMLELLELRGYERVLDVGCGSGYQAAILSMLARQVFAIERVHPLLQRARRALAEGGFAVQAVSGDGWQGWPEHAPFDRILVAAAASEVPRALCAQLADNGVLVVPVGSGRVQRLVVVRRRGTRLESEAGVACRFVPLVADEEAR